MRQTAAQWARDQIEAGENPNKFITFAGPGPMTHRVTLEEAAEMAFIGDIIDREMGRVMKDIEKPGLSRHVAGFPAVQLNERYVQTGVCYPYDGDDVAWRHKQLYGKWGKS